jgi:hypothetical protein
VDGKPHTIITVLPEGFRFLDQTNLAMVLPHEDKSREDLTINFDLRGNA